jgi:hypothetical protein
MKWLLGILSLLIIVAAVALFVIPAKAPTKLDGGPDIGGPPPSLEGLIIVDIYPNTPIHSPVTVTGRARGGWYFEGSFPVELKDAKDKTIIQTPAQAQSDWMTNNEVPFSVTLNFPTQPSGSKGTLVLRKDNPSGLPQNDQSLEVPVVFK